MSAAQTSSASDLADRGRRRGIRDGLLGRGRPDVSASERLLMLAVALLLAALILYPVGTLLGRSFQTEAMDGFTLANYSDMLLTPRLLATIGNTFFVAGITTLLSLVIGGCLAWIVSRTDTWGADAFGYLILIPFLAPSFIGAFAWTILASPRTGLLNQWAIALFGLSGPVFNIYSSWGIVWVLVLVESPLVYLMVSNTFRSINPSLEEASSVAGAGLLRTMLRVTLPLAKPAFFGSALLIFVAVLGSFEVPLVLGTPANFPVLTSEIFAITNETPVRYNLAAAMCSLLMMVAVVVLVVQNMVLARGSYTTVAGKSYRAERIRIGRARIPAFCFVLLYLVAAVGLPIFALAAASLERFWSGSIRPERWSFDNYIYIWNAEMMRGAVANTAVITLAGATLGTVLALAVAYLTHRGKVSGSRIVEHVASLPVAVPGAILALGVSVGWIRSPLYGTLWIILIAMVAKYLPYAQRSIAAGLFSISPELEESARLSGAGQWRAARTILLPLIMPSIVGGWLLMFIIVSRELGMTLFLYTAGTETVPVATYLMMTQRQTATAAACLIQIALVFLVVYVFRRLTTRQGAVA